MPSLQDADVVGADFLGEATIPVAEIIGGQPWDKWLHLTDSGGRPLTRRDARGDSAPSRVHLSIHYKPVGQEVGARQAGGAASGGRVGGEVVKQQPPLGYCILVSTDEAAAVQVVFCSVGWYAAHAMTYVHALEFAAAGMPDSLRTDFA